jgi:hypothetical protein
MVSYRIGFSECVHRRASNRQHVRSGLFNESSPTCQEQNSGRGHIGTKKGCKALLARFALAARAWLPRYWPAAVAGAGFLAAHVLIHLAAIIFGHDHYAGCCRPARFIPPSPTKENIMRSWIERRMLRGTKRICRGRPDDVRSQQAKQTIAVTTADVRV